MMEFFLGFITGIGIVISIKNISFSKKQSFIILGLSILCPLLTFIWCSKKRQFVFGGSNWKFLIQTATIDRMKEPWIILFLYIVLIYFIVKSLIQSRGR